MAPFTIEPQSPASVTPLPSEAAKFTKAISPKSLKMARFGRPVQNEKERLKERNVSISELSLYVLLFLLAVTFTCLQNSAPSTGYADLVLKTALSPQVLISGVWLIVNALALSLNSRTVLVSWLGRDPPEGEFFTPLSRRLVIPTASESETIDEVESTDVVQEEFDNYLERSGAAASAAQRRPNALMLIGTFIALIGLAFFFMTLPGSNGGYISLQPVGEPSHPESEALHLLPRLLMLVFIQVLAGFFLRQYRVSMEDFRYYESIEAQYLSYVLRKRTGDQKAIMSFSKEIMEERQLGMLGKGQTTTSLEAQRLAANEFATLYERIAEVALHAKEKVTGGNRITADKRRKSEHRDQDEGLR